MNLESRQCSNCKKAFKVLDTSKQEYCSRVCQSGNYQEVYTPWKGQKNQLSAEKPTQELKQKKDIGQMLKKLEEKEEKNTPKTQKNIEKKTGPNIKSTKKNTTPDESNGTLTTEKEKTKDKESIMKSTNQKSGNTLERQESKEIQRMDSKASLRNSETVDSPSTNLIDDSSAYLHSLMKGIFANQPEPEIRAYDPDKVKAACLCADQIYKLQKLKLDTVKLQKDLHSYFNKNK